MARKGSKSVGDAAGLSSIFISTDEGLDLLPSGVSVPSGFVGGPSTPLGKTGSLPSLPSS